MIRNPKINFYLLVIILLIWFAGGYLSTVTAGTKVLILGDSITAGYGIKKDLAYPSLLQKTLRARTGKEILVINAGVSGSTTAGAVNRLRWHLKQKPQILILALGANDGLRGLDLKNMKKNLSAGIRLALANKVEVILAGMKIPANYGMRYSTDFETVFIQLAQEYPVTFIPFLLKDVGGRPKLNIADGIHPNQAGHRIIADTVLSYLLPLISPKP